MTDYSQYAGQPAPTQRNAATLVHCAGAAVSLSLVAGIGLWGYKTIARDVSGVPVVLAMEGPMRIAPEDPGGRLADHQGLAVNTIAGVGVAEGPAERLVIAPRPAGLSEEDVAQGALQAYERAAGQAAQAAEAEDEASERPRFETRGDDSVAVAATFTAEDAVIPPDSPLAQSGDPEIQALVSQLTDGAEPLSDAPDPATDDPLAALDALDLPDPLSGDEGAEDQVGPNDPGRGPGRSLRPQSRPVQVASAPQAGATRRDTTVPGSAIAEALAMGTDDAVTEIAPSDLPSGTRLVQIGAFDSAETARREWDRLMPRFSAYLSDKDRVIQEAQSGGRTFFRLRAHGFTDLSDARRFCAAFVAEGVDCIPVVSR